MAVAEFDSLTTTQALAPEVVEARPVSTGINSTSADSTGAKSTGVESTDIQQVSWQFNAPAAAPATQRALIQQSSSAVRDDAPSHALVVGCLIGFGLLSIAVCFSTLPHYWFHRREFIDRMKGYRVK